MKYDFDDARGFKTITRQEIDFLLDYSSRIFETVLTEPLGIKSFAIRRKTAKEKMLDRTAEHEKMKTAITKKMIKEMSSELNKELMYDFEILDLMRALYSTDDGKKRLSIKKKERLCAELSHYWVHSRMENYCMLLLLAEAGEYVLQIMAIFLERNFNPEKGIIELSENYSNECSNRAETKSTDEAVLSDLPF